MIKTIKWQSLKVNFKWPIDFAFVSFYIRELIFHSTEHQVKSGEEDFKCFRVKEKLTDMMLDDIISKDVYAGNYNLRQHSVGFG